MPASNTAINIAAFQVGTDVLLGRLVSYDYDPAPEFADRHPVSSATAFKQLVKRRPTLRATLHMADGAGTASNLGITLFDVGGVSYLGILREATITVNNEAAEASGVNELNQFGQLVSSTWEISGELLVPSATMLHALLVRSTSAVIADHIVAVSCTVAGVTFTGTAALHVTSAGNAAQLSTLSVRLTNSGNLTAPTGTSLLAVAMTGTALTDLHLDTGFGRIGLAATRIPALITSATVRITDAAIVENEFEFRLQAPEALSSS